MELIFYWMLNKRRYIRFLSFYKRLDPRKSRVHQYLLGSLHTLFYMNSHQSLELIPYLSVFHLPKTLIKGYRLL
jgi:hypothetical protein